MDFIMQIAKEYGLFVALVVYVLWDTKQRETRYLNVIETLSEEVKDRLSKIENHLGKALTQSGKEKR